jgi:COP9 signalosome complex subunit 8
MSAAPGTIEELAQLIATAPSPAVLLETFMSVEGDISLRFGNTHLTSDTDFLTVYFSAYILALLLEDEMLVELIHTLRNVTTLADDACTQR